MEGLCASHQRWEQDGPALPRPPDGLRDVRTSLRALRGKAGVGITAKQALAPLSSPLASSAQR